MKHSVDKHRSDRTFTVGDLVYVELHPYRQIFVAQRPNMKISPKFYGPFQVTNTVGTIAYKLALPTTSRIHNVFHVSPLKKHVGAIVTATSLSNEVQDTTFDKEPETILDRIIIKQRGLPVTKILVKWKHQLPKDVTWEFFMILSNAIPHSNLEEKVYFMEGTLL